MTILIRFGIFLALVFSIRVAHSETPASPLKGHMRIFVSQAAELRTEEIQGKNPDWAAIQATLLKMSRNLEEMRRKDSAQGYSPYLDELSGRIYELRKMSKTRNPSISQAYVKLTDSCLRCHSAHLPSQSNSFKGAPE